jgi:hypothetical protein
MRRALRFLRLPAMERRLTFEAAMALTLACVLLKTAPFSRVLKLLGLKTPDGPAPCPADPADPATAKAVARAVARASRNLPFKAVCLPQAAAAALMLRRRGLPVEVHFGVAKRDGAVEAHAWSLCGGVPVSGVAESSRFSPIATFRA